MKCYISEPVMARDGSYSITLTGIREDIWSLWEALKGLLCEVTINLQVILMRVLQLSRA